MYANTWKPLDEVTAQTVAAPDTRADLMDGSDGNDTLVGDAGDDSQVFTSKLIASYALRATGRFDAKRRVCRRGKETQSAKLKSVYMHSVRLQAKNG